MRCEVGLEKSYSVRIAGRTTLSSRCFVQEDVDGTVPPMRVPYTVGAYFSPSELQHSNSWTSANTEGTVESRYKDNR